MLVCSYAHSELSDEIETDIFYEQLEKILNAIPTYDLKILLFVFSMVKLLTNHNLLVQLVQNSLHDDTNEEQPARKIHNVMLNRIKIFIN